MRGNGFKKCLVASSLALLCSISYAGGTSIEWDGDDDDQPMLEKPTPELTAGCKTFETKPHIGSAIYCVIDDTLIKDANAGSTPMFEVNSAFQKAQSDATSYIEEYNGNEAWKTIQKGASNDEKLNLLYSLSSEKMASILSNPNEYFKSNDVGYSEEQIKELLKPINQMQDVQTIENMMAYMLAPRRASSTPWLKLGVFDGAPATFISDFSIGLLRYMNSPAFYRVLIGMAELPVIQSALGDNVEVSQLKFKLKMATFNALIKSVFSGRIEDSNRVPIEDLQNVMRQLDALGYMQVGDYGLLKQALPEFNDAVIIDVYNRAISLGFDQSPSFARFISNPDVFELLVRNGSNPKGSIDKVLQVITDLGNPEESLTARSFILSPVVLKHGAIELISSAFKNGALFDKSVFAFNKVDKENYRMILRLLEPRLVAGKYVRNSAQAALADKVLGVASAFRIRWSLLRGSDLLAYRNLKRWVRRGNLCAKIPKRRKRLKKMFGC